MITYEQVTKARALLQWSIDDLARWSKVARNALFYFEIGAEPLDELSLAQVKTALENGGVEFSDGGQQDVRLREGRVSEQ